MSYTPENNPYIPGDPYSYDLKWMVNDIKHMEERFGELDNQVQEATDQADRSRDEADRSRDEADRSDAEALKSEGFAVGKQDGAAVDPDSPYYENNAEYFADQAQTRGNVEVLKAEGHATGTQNGVPVGSGSPYYENNSKYYSEEAADSAQEAKDYADHIADPVSGLVSTWLAANVDPDTGYVIDKTLKISDAAADAEITGIMIREGMVDSQSIYPQKIKGITGAMQYCYETIIGKKIGIYNGQYAIVNDPNERLCLFEKGFGWVGSTYRIMTVNKSDLSVVTSTVNPRNLAALDNLTAYAITESTLVYLDFNFFDDGKLPGTIKSKDDIVLTNFGSTGYSSGINAYNSGYKAFTPFQYSGSVNTHNCAGYTLYDTDGSIHSYGSIVGDTVAVNGYIAVIYSGGVGSYVEIPEAKYEYTGKTCSVYGDSLTSDAAYYPYLAALTGLNINNCGIGGTRMSGTSADAMHQNARINTLSGDFIVIMAGTNDANSAPTGTISADNIDTSTFVGAYNVALSKIYYRYGVSAGYYNDVDYTGVNQLLSSTLPNIIIIAPPPDFTDTTKYGKLENYVDVVKSIAEFWNIPFIDAFHNMQMNWINKDEFFNGLDYTHYNSKGRSKLGSLIADKFNELYANFSDQ